MANITITGPDGRKVVLRAPEGASDEQIQQKIGQIKAGWGQASAQAPPMSAIDQRASERVANEAERGLVPQASPAQYLPFGSWLDEASAGIDAGLNKISGGRIGQPYDEAKAYQNARQRYIDENASGLSKGAAMAGGMAASVPFGAAQVFRGTTLLPQMGNAALTGAGYGALYGSGEGEGTERVGNAAIGAGIGATTGAAIVPVARGVGNAINYTRNRLAPLPQELRGFERGAVNRVTDDMTSSGLDRAAYARQAGELGEQGMLLDMGDDLRGAAEALAQTRGPQMPVVRNALNNRRDTAPDRIRNQIDASLGREVNLPQYTEQVRRQFNDQARPFYEQFHNTSIPETPEIRRTLSQIPAAAFRKAETLARADGVTHQFRIRPVDNAMTPLTGVQGGQQERVFRGIEYDYLKRAVDDIARTAERGSNEARIYGNLARNLRNNVDAVLSPNDPAQSPWAIGRHLSGEGLEGREAAQLGSGVFSGRRDPNIVQAELADLSQAGQRMYRRGARDDLRQVMGRAATNFGPRGDNAARRALNSEFNRDNLGQIAGPWQANRLTRLIDAENRMAESFNEVMTNSATARRMAAQSRLPTGAGAPVSAQSPRSIGEAAYSIAKRGVNALANGALGERAGRIMTDQARLLAARGIDRDIYVDALFRLAQQRNTTAQQRDVINAMINAVGQQTRTPLIEGATSP